MKEPEAATGQPSGVSLTPLYLHPASKKVAVAGVFRASDSVRRRARLEAGERRLDGQVCR